MEPLTEVRSMADKSSSDSQGYGLLISAVVAIVAIVGQVILFNSAGSTGQFVAMSGEPGPYAYSGLGEAYARGARYGGAVDTNYPSDEGYAGGYYDYDSGQYVGVRGSNFDRNLGGNENRYTGPQADPHGYFDASGGLRTDAGGTQESFNNGAYGKTARQGIERTTLPSDSDRGDLG